MRYTLFLAVGLLVVALMHLSTVHVDEVVGVTANPSATDLASGDDAFGVSAGDAAPVEAPVEAGGIDLRGTMRVVGSIPGLSALILFSCINNFLGGAFMALMDAYGLSMMSVRAWGFLWAVASGGIIIGGFAVARVGLGSNPLRVLMIVNILLWALTALFPVRASVVPLAIGVCAFMLITPFAEAAEQTILQKVVPYHRQGRVFGFAQSIEQAASPLTAFLMGPLTQLVFIPFMTDGAGARAIGSWFGTGPARGIALVFVLTGILGMIATGAAWASPFYRRLRDRYTSAPPSAGDNIPGDQTGPSITATSGLPEPMV